MIFPLVTFDERLWPADSRASLIVPGELPQPYRRLLAHPEHMTVTVEAHYRSSVEVRVLSSHREGELYHRRIVLRLPNGGPVVQYGLVRLNLSCCAVDVRREILEEKIPLGRILIQHDVLRRVEPTAFLRVEPGARLCQAMELSAVQPLFGRTGVIFFDDRPAISVLEILNPTT